MYSGALFDCKRRLLVFISSWACVYNPLTVRQVVRRPWSPKLPSRRAESSPSPSHAWDGDGR